MARVHLLPLVLVPLVPLVPLVLAVSCSSDPSGSDSPDSGDSGPVAGGGSASGGTAATGGSPGAGGRATGGLGGSASAGGAPGAAGGATPTGGQSSSGGSGAGGAASGGSGAVDPLSTDRGTFFGDSRCATAGVLFCDGFEGATIDTAAWSKQGGGTAEIDSSQKARGASSVRFHTTGNGFSFLRLTSIFPVQSDTYHGRMFVRFSGLPVAPQWAHWTIAEAAGQGDGSLIRVGGQWDGQRNRFGVGSDGGPTGDWTNLDQDPGQSPVEPPAGEWMCVEWLHDGQDDVTRFYWDATEHPSLATTASDHGGSNDPYVMPQLESVWIGWWLYQSDPSPSEYDVWIDEVAFDTERVGCVR